MKWPQSRYVIRILIVLVALALGLLADRWPRAGELGQVLEFVCLAAVSFAASQWFLLLLMGLLLGVAWLFFAANAPRFRFLHLLVMTLNRWLGHAEALGTWVILIMVCGLPWMAVKFPLVALIVTFGGLLVDRAGAAVHRRRKQGPPPESAELLWARRPIIYILTGAGIVGLLLLSPGQYRALLPGALALALSCLLRLWATRRAGSTPEARQSRSSMAASRVLSATTDRWGAALLLGGLGVLLWFQATDAATQDARDAAARVARVGRPPADLSTPARLSLFIVSDSQFHELRGTQSAVRFQMIDSIVPVAVRPLELDLLSGVTVAHFAKLYSDHRQNGMLWTHLGDYGDLACSSELQRLEKSFELFGARNLAALVPGNHDSTFTGNFAWHPDWPAACAVNGGTPLRKAETNLRLARLTEQLRANGVETPPVPLSDFISSLSESSAFPTVTRLGMVDGRELLGVFLDSSDYGLLQLGISGVQGDLSIRQLNWVERALATHPKDAAVILFLHHPTDSLSRPARWLLEGFIRRLGARARGIVTAHTHVAALRQHSLGGLTELVVGSVTDPPQEAAVLEITGSGDQLENLGLRLRTVQAVVRPGAGEGYDWGLPADVCAQAMKQVAEAPECDAFTSDQTPDHMAELFDRQQPPSSPEDMSKRQRMRAQRFHACVCRANRCTDARTEDPLDPEVYTRQALIGPESVRHELVCLSWAASVLQGRKGEGWQFNRSLVESLERSVAYDAFVAQTPVSSPAATARIQ